MNQASCFPGSKKEDLGLFFLSPLAGRGRTQRGEAHCPLSKGTVTPTLAVRVRTVGGRHASYCVQACRYRNSRLPGRSQQGGTSSGKGEGRPSNGLPRLQGPLTIHKSACGGTFTPRRNAHDVLYGEPWPETARAHRLFAEFPGSNL